MNPLGLHHAGGSPLHRLGVGWKVLALLVLASGTFALSSPVWLAVVVAAVALGFAVARIPLRRCWTAARGVLVIAAFLFLVQWWLIGLDQAAVVGLRVVATLTAAALFTLTTRVDAIVAMLERRLAPLRRFGVRPGGVALLVGLMVQAVTTLSRIAGEVREAQRARGAERSVVAFAVPLLVRTVRHADELGEALAARGMGDR
ncbi:energy-coupling factor transporter transmembrane component T [Actinomycetes bacterium KLBMP 9759]